MANYTLTTAADTVTGDPSDDTVTVPSASTLNPTDSLDGGGGYNTLQLMDGGGTFDLTTLTHFANFQEIDISNSANGNSAGGASIVTLPDSMDFTVNATSSGTNGSFPNAINLGNGTTTVNVGVATRGYTVYASSGTAIVNGRNVSVVGSGGGLTVNGGFSVQQGSGSLTINSLDGGPFDIGLSTGTSHIVLGGPTSGDSNITVSSGQTSLDLSAITGDFTSNRNYVTITAGAIDSNDVFIGTPASILANEFHVEGSGELDFTTMTFGNSWHALLYGSNEIFDVTSAALAHFLYFAPVTGTSDVLRTADATLDLTNLDASSAELSITSTNTAGTTFTVNSVDTGLRVVGGPGNDALVLNGADFTANQRDGIFAQGGIEKIVEPNGTYLAPGQLFDLTGGGNANVTGGNGDDGFKFGNTFDGNDHVDGGTGTNNQMQVGGSYASTIVLDPAKVTNIQVLAFAPGNDYSVQTLAGFVGAGHTFSFWSASMSSANHVTIDGSAETTGGAFQFFLGQGADTATGGGGNDLFYGEGGADLLTGGAGADTFAYLSANDSNGAGGTAYDTIADFTVGTDTIKLTDTAVTAIDAAVGGSLSGASFDGDLALLLGNGQAQELDQGHAVLVTASAGDLSGQTFLVVGTAGAAHGYAAGADYVIDLQGAGVLGLATTDFV